MRLAKSGRVLVRARWSGCRGTLVRAEGSSVGGQGSERGGSAGVRGRAKASSRATTWQIPETSDQGTYWYNDGHGVCEGYGGQIVRNMGLGSEGRLLRFALACLDELRSPGRCIQKPLTGLLSLNRFSVLAHQIGRRASEQPWVQLSPGLVGGGKGNKDVLFLPAS